MTQSQVFDLPFCSKSCSVDGAFIIIPELNDGTSEGNPQKDLLKRSKQINKLDNLDLFFFPEIQSCNFMGFNTSIFVVTDVGIILV